MPSRTKLTSAQLTNTTILFLLAAPLVILLYGLFVFNPSNIDTLWLYCLQVIADGISIIVLLSLWLTILMDVLIPSHHRAYSPHSILGQSDEFGPVDVFITVAGEDIETVRKTVEAAIAMDHPHKTFILDDGRSAAVKKLAKVVGAEYLTRADRAFAKSGNINNGLKNAVADFFVILDADHVPKKHMLTSLLSYMKDEKVGMVQSPQHYHNTEKFIAAGTSQAQEIFYKFICPAKNTSNSCFSVGTNVMFRRTTIEQIGGIAMINHSEDIWTSLKLHEHGWTSIFVNDILAIGEAPDTIQAFSKQQQRWAQGGLSMLMTKNPLFSEKLTVDQKIQYFSANFFFLVGFAMLAYLLFPILYLLFGIKSLQTDNGIVWLLHYLPYFGLYYSLTWLLLGKIQLATISTALGSFWAYISALFIVIFDTKTQWIATSSTAKSVRPIMSWIWPHWLIIFLTLGGFLVGWYKPVDFWTTLFNTLWAAVNMYLLFLFVTSEKRSAK